MIHFLRALCVILFAAVVAACGGGDVAEVGRAIDNGAAIGLSGKKKAEGVTPLHLAAIHGHAEIALALIKAGADVGATDNDGRTALHFAALSGQTDIVLALVKAGADVGAKDSADSTPLHWAASGGNIETIHALIKAGADLYALTNDEKPLTPLDYAIIQHGKNSAAARALQKAMGK